MMASGGHVGTPKELRFRAALNDFRRLRQQARLEKIAGRLRGKPVELLSFEDVATKLKVMNRATLGLREIPLDAIVGSVGRYHDFSRTFLPLVTRDASRWASVKTAAPDPTLLPPIDVYQIGELYFVLDGNHRVSIARQRGQSHIGAYVTEVKTRVALSPEASPDELIWKAEYAAFLEATRLDEIRPGADLRVSVAGQYRKIENHIEVQRFYVEVAREREMSDEEAVGYWYDEVYLPTVGAVREQGILRHFPGRTETDFYLWLAEHQAEVRHHLGWDFKPDRAVAKLSAKLTTEGSRLAGGLGARVLAAVRPGRARKLSRQLLAQERLVARYSDRLFSEILVPVCDTAGGQRAVEQALMIAGIEQSKVLGLKVGAPGPAGVGDERDGFAGRCQEAGVEGELAGESGDWAERVGQRAALADLVVLDRAFPGQNGEGALSAATLNVIAESPVPVLVVAAETCPMGRLLLAYDDRAKGREALFVAAYLAEKWDADVVVVTVLEKGRTSESSVEHARDYLAMHEVEATVHLKEGAVAPTILKLAAEEQCDAIIMGGYGAGRLGRRGKGNRLEEVLRQTEQPVLVCP
jgi:nucleotide-binding universal stress UspA family protein